MMRFTAVRVVVALVLSILALGGICLLVSHPASPILALVPPPALLDLHQDAADLGEGKPGEVKQGRFTIVNHGHSPMHFTADAGCDCLRLEPKRGRLAPGERQDVRVALKLKTEGRDEIVTVNVEAVSGERREADQLPPFAHCPAPLSAMPAVVDFGRVPQGKAAALSVQLYAKGRKPWVRSPLQVQVVPSHLSVEICETPSGAELRLTVRRDAPPGLLGGEVVLHAPAEGLTLAVPVRGEVLRPVQVAPAMLRFPESGGQRMLLVWRGDHAPLGPLTVEPLPPGVQVRVVSEPGTQRLRLAVTLSDDAARETEVKLRLRLGASDAIEVPLVREQ